MVKPKPRKRDGKLYTRPLTEHQMLKYLSVKGCKAGISFMDGQIN